MIDPRGATPPISMELPMISVSRPSPPPRLSLELGPCPYVVRSQAVRHTGKIRSPSMESNTRRTASA